MNSPVDQTPQGFINSRNMHPQGRRENKARWEIMTCGKKMASYQRADEAKRAFREVKGGGKKE